jgi:hypothetical protein
LRLPDPRRSRSRPPESIPPTLHISSPSPSLTGCVAAAGDDRVLRGIGVHGVGQSEHRGGISQFRANGFAR